MLITIRLQGCDDSTIFSLEVNQLELNFLEKISKISKETSTYGCMPILSYRILNTEEF